MKGRWGKYLLGGLLGGGVGGLFVQSRPIGVSNIKDGRLDQSLELVNQPNAKGSPVNAKDYSDQLMEISTRRLRCLTATTAPIRPVQSWMASGADTHAEPVRPQRLPDGRCRQLRQRAVYRLLYAGEVQDALHTQQQGEFCISAVPACRRMAEAAAGIARASILAR